LTALSEIRSAITARLRAQHAIAGGRLDARDLQSLRRHQIFVEVGRSARQSLIAELESMPREIDGVPVYTTDDFTGWQVVVR
jgi:hypothetical protein